MPCSPSRHSLYSTSRTPSFIPPSKGNPRIHGVRVLRGLFYQVGNCMSLLSPPEEALWWDRLRCSGLCCRAAWELQLQCLTLVNCHFPLLTESASAVKPGHPNPFSVSTPTWVLGLSLLHHPRIILLFADLPWARASWARSELLRGTA